MAVLLASASALGAEPEVTEAALGEDRRHVDAPAAAPAQPEQPSPPRTASTVGPGVRVAAQVGVGLLVKGALVGAGVAIGLSRLPCQTGFCLEPLNSMALMAFVGLCVSPVIEYLTGLALGGTGSMGSHLAGTVLGILAAAGLTVVLAFSAATLGKGLFVSVAGGVLYAVAPAFGGALATELEGRGPTVSFAPMAGGGALVLSQRF